MKLKDLKSLTGTELVTHVSQIRRDLAQLKIQRQVNTLENPLKLRTLRREIARCMTLVTQSR